jgi:hypothetical protein
MTAHKHAAAMLLYAQDASETDKPWTFWQCKRVGHIEWHPMDMYPTFSEEFEYRRKPRTIRIGERDVPEPMRVAPVHGSKFWLVVAHSLDKITPMHWNGGGADVGYLKHGVCHKTKEAAIVHAEALILVSGGTL